jgi:hypothetical protein
MTELVVVPSPDAAFIEFAKFASTYNGYTRFCSNANEYESLFSLVEKRYFENKEISDSLGVDYLRAWLFLLYRRDYFTNSSDNPDEFALWGLLMERIAEKSGGTVPLLT